jgi:hypothetical protein
MHPSLLLAELGVTTECPPFSGSLHTNSTVKKRKKKTEPTGKGDGLDDEELNVIKKPRISPPSESVSSKPGIRRSTRLEGRDKTVNYGSDNFERLPREVKKVLTKSYDNSLSRSWHLLHLSVVGLINCPILTI